MAYTKTTWIDGITEITATLLNKIETGIYDAHTQKSDIAQPSWVAPSLGNAWVNYGGNYPTVGYYKNTVNTVFIKGMVKSGSIGNAIFILPLLYRPATDLYFICPANDAIAEVIVKSDGSVLAAYGSNAWFSINGISFRAEQ